MYNIWHSSRKLTVLTSLRVVGKEKAKIFSPCDGVATKTINAEVTTPSLGSHVSICEQCAVLLY